MNTEAIDAYLCAVPFTHRTLSGQGKIRYWLRKQSEGGHMFALLETEPHKTHDEERPLLLSFGAGEQYEPLLEEPYFQPAPYLARAGWVALPTVSPIPFARVIDLLRSSYDLTRSKLTSRLRNQIPELKSTIR